MAGARWLGYNSPMSIPFLDLTAHHAPLQDEFRAAFDRVLTSNQFCLGSEVTAFEEEVGAFTAPARAVAVSNGTDALVMALMALEIGPGDEVIVPAFSFFATAGAVLRVGARPVFVDIDPHTLTMDPALIGGALTARTRAIMPVHLYGQCADMNAIRDIAIRHGLRVIEDAAQALGATHDGRAAGSLGDMACFSFYPTKNLGALGEAGLITATEDDLLERCRIIRNQGMEPRYYHHVLGGNFRMDGLQGAALRVKLPYLAKWNEARASHARAFDAALSPIVQVPTIAERRTHIYHQYTVRTPDRDGLMAHLGDRGIASAIFYPLTLYRQPCMEQFDCTDFHCPVSEEAAATVLSLPVFPELTPEQVDAICAAVVAWRAG